MIATTKGYVYKTLKVEGIQRNSDDFQLEQVDSGALVDRLNDEGEKGWKVVFMEKYGAHPHVGIHIILMREVSEKPENMSDAEVYSRMQG